MDENFLTKIVIVSLFIITFFVLPKNFVKKVSKRDVNKRPLIVFWKKPWKGFDRFLGVEFCDENGVFECDIKYGRNFELIEKADAVMIHPVFSELEKNGSNFFKKGMLNLVEKIRKPEQLYIFAQWESPEFHRGDYNYMNGFFNGTMTYLPDEYLGNSEFNFWFPYDSIGSIKLKALLDEKLTKQLESEKFYKENSYKQATFDANFKELDFPEKKYDVAAVVSHCRSIYRNNLIKNLKREMNGNIDLYGECFINELNNSRAQKLSKIYLNRSNKLNFDKYQDLFDLLKQYKFYLAFENSRCEYYISEKIFENSILTRTVPIVAGASRYQYEKLVPKSAFIHVDDFESMKQLSNYIKYLLKNGTAYMEYFDWHSETDPNIQLATVESFRNTGICKLCKQLKQMDKKHHFTVKNIHSFWYGENGDRCKPVRNRPGQKYIETN